MCGSANQRIGEFELKVARLAAVEGELAALVPLAMRGATHQPDSELEDRITAAQSKVAAAMAEWSALRPVCRRRGSK